MTFFTKEKKELVKIEIYVPRATFGNYEKLKQALKYEDIQSTITHVMEQKIRQTLGSHYVPVSKDIYDTLKVKARQKNMEIDEFVTEIILDKTKESETK